MSEAEPTTTPMSPRRAASRIRVTVFVNGGEPPGGRLLTFEPAFTTWEELLKAAGAKLGATRPFTRVFVENGAEADSVGDIFSGDQLYFSHGEDFRKAEEAKSTVVPLPVGTDGSINSSAEDEKHQFVTSLATSVASAATTLYESSSQYVKGRSPGFVKVTLETVETRVGPYANPLLTKLLEYTSWADEKLDGVYNRLQKRNKAFQASPLAQTVNDNLVIPFKEFVVEPSSAFFNAASDKYRQLDINRDGKVAVDSFVAGLKQQLGSAWNDKLIEPAKAFHAAASTQIANNKTIQDAKELLDKTWKDVVVANFKAKITAPAEAFYQMALSNFMALRAASGNGAVSFQDFVAGLRSSFGRLWSERLVPPAQHLYDQFTVAAEKATNAILGPEDEDEDDSEYVPQYREVKRKE